jgi:aryl-alcohol dehydrogenase
MTIQARAAVIEREDDVFVMHDVSVEDPRPDEVLVRMVATGNCATEAQVQQQLLPSPVPAVLWHEGAGIVERIGSTVTHLKPSDHVVLSYH